MRNICRQAEFAHIISVIFYLFRETLKPYFLSNFRGLGKTAERAQSGITRQMPVWLFVLILGKPEGTRTN